MVTGKSPVTPDGDLVPPSVTIPVETWQQMLTAIDNANSILTHQETIADQMEQVANSLVSLAEKIRGQAKGIRENRQRLNATLYPATSVLRGLRLPQPELLQ